MIEDMLVNCRFGDTEEVTLRVGARTGDRLVLTDRAIDRSSAGISLPAGTIQTDPDAVAAGRPASFTEEVGGRQWQISAQSFFQSSPEGAEALADVVGRAVAEAPDGPLADLYAGVGLFAGLVAGDRQVTAVEVSRSSIADARVNIPDARIVPLNVEQWTPKPHTVVVADPARSGLGAKATDVVVGTGAARVVLVSCDAGSLGRDAGLLMAAGYTFRHATTVDMFPHTSHIEVVSVFDRSD